MCALGSWVLPAQSQSANGCAKPHIRVPQGQVHPHWEFTPQRSLQPRRTTNTLSTRQDLHNFFLNHCMAPELERAKAGPGQGIIEKAYKKFYILPVSPGHGPLQVFRCRTKLVRREEVLLHVTLMCALSFMLACSIDQWSKLQSRRK